MTTRDLMTREEVLARLNIKPATLYSYVSRGLIGTPPQGPLYRNRSAVEMAKAGSSFESVSQLLMTGVWQDGVTAWGALDTPQAVLPLFSAYAGKLEGGDIANLLGMVPLALGMQGRGAAEISDGSAVQAARLIMQTMTGCLGFLSEAR